MLLLVVVAIIKDTLCFAMLLLLHDEGKRWRTDGIFRTDGKEMMESIDAGSIALAGVKCGAQICADPHVWVL